MDNEKFSGYILAGGKSSRMGSDKAFLKIGEKTFIENAVETLKPVCNDRIKIVLNNSQNYFIEKLPQNIPHIFDIYKNRAALGGIHACLNDCETKFAVILAVDLPFVKSIVIEKLSEIAIETKQSSVIVPRQTDGRFQPLAAVYLVENCLPKVRDILDTGKSASVKSFLENVSIKIVKQENLSFDRDIFLNINKPEDLTIIDS